MTTYVETRNYLIELFEGGDWQFSYRKGAAKPEIKAVADTPENALCQLAIELFKQGVMI